ncbi:unnamed protein product, partial [Rotaria magnacalcarata]
MQIAVKTLNGTTFTPEMAGTDTIDKVKTKIQEMEHIPREQQHLMNS